MSKPSFLRISAISFLCGAGLFAGDVAGKWSGTFDRGSKGDNSIELELRQQGRHLTGTILFAHDKIAQLDGIIAGDRLFLAGRLPADSVIIELSLSNNELRGSMRPASSAIGKVKPLVIVVTRNAGQHRAAGLSTAVRQMVHGIEAADQRR